jgi:hypothetical protein
MKKTRVKQVLDAAAKLPPAKARALVKAVMGKAGAVKAKDSDGDLEAYLADASAQMEAAMANAALAALERSLQ